MEEAKDIKEQPALTLCLFGHLPYVECTLPFPNELSAKVPISFIIKLKVQDICVVMMHQSWIW